MNMESQATTRRFSRWWLGLTTVLVLILAGSWHVRQRLSDLPPLRTVPIKRGDLRMFIAATGTVEPHSIVELGALVSGTVIAFGDGVNQTNFDLPGQAPAPVGTLVTKGGVLVKIDDVLYQLALEQARISHRLAEAEANRLRTRSEQAKRELERAELLRSTNSESQYDKIATGCAIAEDDFQMAEARTEQTASQVKQAEINLARTTIRSPIDGVVIDHRVNLGQQAGPASPGMFLITEDLKQMRVRTSVSETDIGKVFPGQHVEFTVDGYRDTRLTGSVEQVLMNARVQGNFVTYDVLVQIDPNDVNLLPHMTADVQLETVNRSGVWLVPSESLEWQPDRKFQVNQASGDTTHVDQFAKESSNSPFIYVAVEDGQLQAFAVRVGADDGVKTEIFAAGLKESMPIVVGTVRETTLARIIPSVKTLR